LTTSAKVYDCIIIGAGLAGLVAARNLHRSNHEILLLEARDRVGGRMYGRTLPNGQWLDFGGQWVGPTQERFLALLDEYGIDRFPSPAEGRTVLLFEGKRYEFQGFFQGFFEGDPPDIDPEDWKDAMTAWARFEALAQTLSPTYPYGDESHSSRARELDSLTFSQWIEENTRTAFGRWYLSYMARAVGFLGPAEPNQVSLLHVLWGQRCAPQAEHPEAELLHGGAGQIPALLAEELAGRVRLGEPAVRVSQDQEGVRVDTLENQYHARYVIIAMPPHLTGRILYDPPLPPMRQQLVQRMPMGACAKILLSYDRPFWRERGLAGIGEGDCAWIELCADSSDPATGIGVMAAFVVGDRYGRWRSLDEGDRRLAVLSDLCLYFGPEARSPLTYDEADWPSDPWTGGAYAAFMPPGVWTSFGAALTAPVGRIYWAGTEMAERWPGFFEGAVRTGEAAAEAVGRAIDETAKS
jgi:L-amino acid dehydrogenase